MDVTPFSAQDPKWQHGNVFSGVVLSPWAQTMLTPAKRHGEMCKFQDGLLVVEKDGYESFKVGISDSYESYSWPKFLAGGSVPFCSNGRTCSRTDFMTTPGLGLAPFSEIPRP